jgi:hypothetical protein
MSFLLPVRGGEKRMGLPEKKTTELKLARTLAQVVVYGHVLLFIYGFFIWQFGTLDGSEAAQLILMGSPLLALVATAAFDFVMRGQVGDDSPTADPTKVQMALVVTGGFVAMLFVAYTITLFNTSITAPTIKLLVGSIETGFGAYIGIVKDTFFPSKKGNT